MRMHFTKTVAHTIAFSRGTRDGLCRQSETLLVELDASPKVRDIACLPLSKDSSEFIRGSMSIVNISLNHNVFVDPTYSQV